MANPIYNICKKIKTIKNEEFEEVVALANEQMSYIHPLKSGYQLELNNTGDHNLLIIQKLKELQEIIIKKKQ